jgi:hypothetical protein
VNTHLTFNVTVKPIPGLGVYGPNKKLFGLFAELRQGADSPLDVGPNIGPVSTGMVFGLQVFS